MTGVSKRRYFVNAIGLTPIIFLAPRIGGWQQLNVQHKLLNCLCDTVFGIGAGHVLGNFL